MERVTSSSSSSESINDFLANTGWEDLTVTPGVHEVPKASDIAGDGGSGFTLVEQEYEDAKAGRDEEDEAQDAMVDQRVAEGTQYAGPGAVNHESLHLVIDKRKVAAKAIEVALHGGLDLAASGISLVNPIAGAAAKKGADIIKSGISIESR